MNKLKYFMIYIIFQHINVSLRTYLFLQRNFDRNFKLFKLNCNQIIRIEQ